MMMMIHIEILTAQTNAQKTLWSYTAKIISQFFLKLGSQQKTDRHLSQHTQK